MRDVFEAAYGRLAGMSARASRPPVPAQEPVREACEGRTGRPAALTPRSRLLPRIAAFAPTSGRLERR